jgi:hypothetical protein
LAGKKALPPVSSASRFKTLSFLGADIPKKPLVFVLMA